MKLSINIVVNLITICPTITYYKPNDPACSFRNPEGVGGQETWNPGNLTTCADQGPTGPRPLRQVVVDPEIGKLQAVTVHPQWLKTVSRLPGTHGKGKRKTVRIQPHLVSIDRPGRKALPW